MLFKESMKEEGNGPMNPRSWQRTGSDVLLKYAKPANTVASLTAGPNTAPGPESPAHCCCVLGWKKSASAGPRRPTDLHMRQTTLKSLTSSNKESRPFFLGDKSIWSCPSVSSLSDCSIWRSEGYCSLAFKAFGAFEFTVPQFDYRLGKMQNKESRLLNLRWYCLQGKRAWEGGCWQNHTSPPGQQQFREVRLLTAVGKNDHLL